MKKGGSSIVKPEHLRFQRGDVLAIVIVLLLAAVVAVSYLPKDTSSPVRAEIYREGELVKTLTLDMDTQFEIEGRYTNVIRVENGQIAIIASDCPGEDCVHSGAVKATGRSIVCLPNEVEVRIVSGMSDVDFVVG